MTTSYLLRRLAALVPTVIGVVTIVFFLIHLTPGDPVDVMDKEELRRQLGLDQPIATQYARFVRGLLAADLGRSLYSGQPVRALVLGRYPATLELAGAGLCVALLVFFRPSRSGSAWRRS
jgi:peptide/nickel transport system permease protein